jgi:hypothetical protein
MNRSKNVDKHCRKMSNSNVTMLSAAVFDKGVDEFGLNQIRRVKLIQDKAQVPEIFRRPSRCRCPPILVALEVVVVLAHLRLKVVLDATQNGETGDEDGIGVVSFRRIFTKFDESIDTAESEKVSANCRVIAQSGKEEICLIRIF